MATLEAIRKITFIHDDYQIKPTLPEVGGFLLDRWDFTGEPGGIKLSRDKQGNSVYESTDKMEYTFAGEVPPTLIASLKGRQLVTANKDLLRKITQGDLQPTGKTLGGQESTIYKINLNTGDKEVKPFALKYTFPLTGNNGDIDEYYHTSGVVAMRIMQEARAEDPLPGINYNAPVLATHNLTLSPFLYDGLHSIEVAGAIDGQFQRSALEDLLDNYDVTAKDLELIKIMREADRDTDDIKLKFSRQLTRSFSEGSKALKDWVTKKIQQNASYQAFDYTNGDTAVSQSVVSVPDLFDVFRRFQVDPSFNDKNPDFQKAVYRSLTLVELGSGYTNSLKLLPQQELPI